MSETKLYTDRSNAKRAAERMIEKGEALSIDYGIRTTDGGKFEIVWRIGDDERRTETKDRLDGQSAAAPEAPQAASPAKATNGAAGAKTARQRASAPALKPGEMPAKPVITSAANKSYQSRVDALAKMADDGDWAGIEAYQVNGVNTYAKVVTRYRDALLAAHRVAV